MLMVIYFSKKKGRWRIIFNMDLDRIFRRGPFYVSYRESFAFYFMFDCAVCSVTSLLAAWVLVDHPGPRFLMRFRPRCALEPNLSRWMQMYTVLLYLGGLILICPIFSFLYIASSDFVPQTVIACILHGLIAFVGWSMKPKSQLVTALALVAVWSGSLSLSFMIQTPTMFDFLDSSWEVWIGLLASTPLSCAAIYTSLRNEQTFRLMFRRWRKCFIVLIFSTTFGAFLTLFFAGICMAPFASSMQGPQLVGSAGLFGVTTRFLRSFTDPVCRNITPTSVCHVYITAGPDLGSSLFVNVHMGEGAADFLELEIEGFAMSDNNDAARKRFSLFETPLIEPYFQRQVWSIFVSGLDPNRDYSFRLVSNRGPVGAAGYVFKTPSSDSLVVVAGGDAGVTRVSKKIVQRALSTNPDIFIIGGDVAYDNAMFSCACVWDEFLSFLVLPEAENMRLIPLSFAVGNHDIGFNDNNEGATKKRKCDMTDVFFAKPLFFAWFPFQASMNENSLHFQPDPICKRTPVRVHSLIGVANLWIFDSGYITPLSEQVDFADSQFKHHINSHGELNLAFYHVPLYPVSSWDFDRSAYLRTSLGPNIFDKHKFAINFENHVHMFKRTVPLRANATHENGTIYTGDGNMGVESPSPGSILQDAIFEKKGTDYNFFLVRIASGGVANVTAFNEEGALIDSFNHPS